MKHQTIHSRSTVSSTARGFNGAGLILAFLVVLILLWSGCDSDGGGEDDPPLDPGTPQYTNSLGMQFVRIGAGTFRMGADGAEADERPVHDVVISRDFYIGRYEVTQAEWEQVMGENPSHFADCGGDCPVETVSWDDVQEFIARLNEREEVEVYRLPTEAEWEYAARAGVSELWLSGNESEGLELYGWYMGNSDDTTHPVGQKQPNAWGLYDVHGNVYEWVQDFYEATYYSGGATTDPQGPDMGSAYVVRGGTWYTHPWFTRLAFRAADLPDSRISGTGFRLARATQ